MLHQEIFIYLSLVNWITELLPKLHWSLFFSYWQEYCNCIKVNLDFMETQWTSSFMIMNNITPLNQ